MERAFLVAKVPQTINGETVFKNQVISLENYLEDKPEVPLALSELDLKRMNNPKTRLNATIEFAIEYVEIPIQNQPKERPVFLIGISSGSL